MGLYGLRWKFRCSKSLFELGQMLFTPHCDLLGLNVSVTIYNEEALLKTSFHVLQHVYKEDDLMLRTLIQLYKAKVEGEKRGHIMPKVNRQDSGEVGIKPVFPSSLDSALAVQNMLPLKVFLHNGQWDSGFM